MRPQRPPRRWIFALIAPLVVVAVTALTTTIVIRATEPADAAATTQTGVCVQFAAHDDGELRARQSHCDRDGTFLVGATITDPVGECGEPDLVNFPVPFADERSALLCVLPNYRVDHCYRPTTPSGMFSSIDCADRRSGDFRVDEVHDSADKRLCPAKWPGFSFAYPSQPRIYCVTFHSQGG